MDKVRIHPGGKSPETDAAADTWPLLKLFDITAD
jgi:hypothetical protein